MSTAMESHRVSGVALKHIWTAQGVLTPTPSRMRLEGRAGVGLGAGQGAGQEGAERGAGRKFHLLQMQVGAACTSTRQI